jgi:ribonucleoside-diphosphate reductase alpha chain
MTDTKEKLNRAFQPGYNTTPRYTKQEVVKAATEYFGNDFPADVWVRKYALRTNEDIAAPYCELTPSDMHDRLATEISKIEKRYANPVSYEAFRSAMDGFSKIVPQGSPMYGIGNHFVNISLSNCVVVASPEDNISSIMGRTSAELGNLFKRRCGVGLSIDTLRPERMSVDNSAISSTGAWSFADHFSNVCRKIGQNGRRGALMVTMDVRHPDIHQFTFMKQDLTQVTGANISIMLGDDFMNAAEMNADWIARWPITLTEDEVEDALGEGGTWQAVPKGPMNPVDNFIWVPDSPTKKFFFRKFRAKELWTFINECARNTAEPGILFWDNYKQNLPANFYPGFESVSTNPCSEIALSPYDSCRLTSLNLKGFVCNAFRSDAYFDFEDFDKTVRIAMRVMDDIVDLEIDCIRAILKKVDEPEEKELWGRMLQAAIDGRRTGLGTHGLGDCLACLHLRYDSEEALEMVDRIYQTLRNSAYDESVNMAIERGPFPVFDWEKEKHCRFIQRLPQELQDRIAKYGRRNISLLTNAPTGSVSIVTMTSSGIEPTFRFMYTRRTKINPNDHGMRVDYKDSNGDCWMHFPVFERNLQEYLDMHPEAQAEWDRIQSEVHGTTPDKTDELRYDALMKSLPDYFIDANHIDPLKRVRLQGVLQSYIDHGVSSTINLPETVTAATVQNIYEESWKAGLKGVTVYRDKCRSGVLITNSQANSDKDDDITESHAPKRPAVLSCDIHHSNIAGQQWTILVGKMESGKPYEIFGGKAESVDIPKKYTTGFIRKRKCDKPNAKGRYNCYDLVLGDLDDPLVVKDIAVAFADGDYGIQTRMISQLLRHGVHAKYVAEQLSRDSESTIVSFNKVMARILRKYVRDEEGDFNAPVDFCKSGSCE